MKSSKNNRTIKDNLKKAYDFIFKDDSLLANLAFLVFAYLSIKFVIFPVLGFLLGTSFPLVAIVSGSMEHKIVNHDVCGKQFADGSTKSLNFNQWWEHCGHYYEDNYQLSKEDFSEFDYTNGLNIGDVMILRGKEPKDIEVGEIMVFSPKPECAGAPPGPVIHRVIEKKEVNGEYLFTTKGDHNSNVWTCLELDITEDRILAVGEVRLPYIGYVKVWISRVMGVV